MKEFETRRPDLITASPEPETTSAEHQATTEPGTNFVAVPGLVRRAPTSRQAATADPLGGTDASPEIASALSRLRGAGTRLPPTVAGRAGAALSTNLEHVSIHADSESHNLTQSLQARAFTHGSDIYFQAGAYNPTTGAGVHLLNHELAHVAQQQQVRPGSAGSTQIGRADDQAEADAESTARRIDHAEPAQQPVITDPADSASADLAHVEAVTDPAGPISRDHTPVPPFLALRRRAGDSTRPLHRAAVTETVRRQPVLDAAGILHDHRDAAHAVALTHLGGTLFTDGAFHYQYVAHDQMHVVAPYAPAAQIYWAPELGVELTRHVDARSPGEPLTTFNSGLNRFHYNRLTSVYEQILTPNPHPPQPANVLPGRQPDWLWKDSRNQWVDALGRVLTAAFQVNKQYLIAQNAQQEFVLPVQRIHAHGRPKYLGGLPCPTGGNVDPGETDHQAADRELREESHNSYIAQGPGTAIHAPMPQVLQGNNQMTFSPATVRPHVAGDPQAAPSPETHNIRFMLRIADIQAPAAAFNLAQRRTHIRDEILRLFNLFRLAQGLVPPPNRSVNEFGTSSAITALVDTILLSFP